MIIVIGRRYGSHRDHALTLVGKNTARRHQSSVDVLMTLGVVNSLWGWKGLNGLHHGDIATAGSLFSKALGRQLLIVAHMPVDGSQFERAAD